MKVILTILLITILISFNSRSKYECMKITCLNPKDTISQKVGEVKTYFLVESLGDTLTNFDIRPSCGCEYAIWNKAMKVFPNHPDTIIIVSQLKDYPGQWLKQTTIMSGNCTQLFYTGPWYVTE